MSKIETLKNKSGEAIYPLTSTKAVVDENGNTIENRLVVADGEDLVTDGNVLRLKDRPNTDGMGYVILRKDKTFQEQVTKPNTIYEIRYDFDLNGAEITIPENCVLKFEGGSLGNGSLIGNSTLIEFNGGLIAVVLRGTFKNEYLNAIWFGCVHSEENNIIDNTIELNRAITSSGNTSIPVSIPNVTIFHRGLILPENASITGCGINSSILRLLPTSKSNNLTIVANNCGVSNLTIYGNGSYLDFDAKYELYEGNGICICNGSRFGMMDTECNNSKLFNLRIVRCGNNGLGIIDKQKWVYGFYNITIAYCANIGFYDVSTDNTFTGFNISHCHNLGLYAGGARNRYSNMKIFINGYDYRNNDGTTTKPTGIYWQGLRVVGDSNIFNSIDIQECGAELLEIINSARNNILIATLDRPGYGKTHIGDFMAYNIKGIYNTVVLSRIVKDDYHEKNSHCNLSNHLIENVCNFSNNKYYSNVIGNSKNGYNKGVITKIKSNRGDINSSNSNLFITFTGDNATATEAINFAINKSPQFNFGFSFRAYLQGTTRTTCYIMYKDSSGLEKYIILFVRKNSDNIIECGIEDDSFKDYSIVTNKTGSTIVDVYVNNYNDTTELVVKDGESLTSAVIKDKKRSIVEAEEITSIRFIKGTTLSDFHLMQGFINHWMGTQQPYATYYPLKDSIQSSSDSITTLRPNTDTVGFMYFDSALNKPIWWNGTEWVEGDNQAAEIQRAGTWSQRPNADGSYLDNGFQYFLLESEPDEDPDGNPIESLTGNGKAIWWIQDGRKWVDALGNTITGSLGITDVKEVRHIINGEEYKVLTTDDESHNATIYAPTELGNDNYVVAQQNDKAVFVDPADIGLK